MLNYSNFRKKILSENNLLDRRIVRGDEITINKNFEVKVNGVVIGESFENLEEAQIHVSNYVNMNLETIDYDSVPTHVLVGAIEKHHGDGVRITHKLIESYEQKLSTKEFTIDPVISELKSIDAFGKYEFVLNDGSRISISEETCNTLRHLLRDKYDIVEFMKESSDNFKQVVKAVRD
jgi:hypothetical protein